MLEFLSRSSKYHEIKRNDDLLPQLIENWCKRVGEISSFSHALIKDLVSSLYKIPLESISNSQEIEILSSLNSIKQHEDSDLFQTLIKLKPSFPKERQSAATSLIDKCFIL